MRKPFTANHGPCPKQADRTSKPPTMTPSHAHRSIALLPQRAPITAARAWPLRVFGLSLALMLGACADFSGILPAARTLLPESLGLRTVPLPAQQKPVAASLAATRSESGFDQLWWQTFKDPQLDALVAQALQASPNLRAAQARIVRAQAVSEGLGANEKVQAIATLDASQQRFSAVGMYPPPLAGGNVQLANAQLNLSYEWDFFGKNRAALDASIGATQAAIADAQQARLLLSTQVTRTYLTMLRLQAQRALQASYLAQREQANVIARARKDAGLDSELQFLSTPLAGSMPEIRQQIEALGEQVALARNSLAALVGKTSLDLEWPDDALQVLQPAPQQDSVPMDLLGRRPDIVAARWRVEAATADMAYAKALFYPNINLTAFVGLNSVGWSNITNAGSEQWGLGPALRLPVFDTGRLRANLHGKSAELDAAVESYNALLLEAVRDVNEQLTSLRYIGAQQKEQKLAQANAQALLEIAQQRYASGLSTRAGVLNAQSALIPHQRQAIELHARALETQAQLLRSLGGGYLQASASTDTSN